MLKGKVYVESMKNLVEVSLSEFKKLYEDNNILAIPTKGEDQDIDLPREFLEVMDSLCEGMSEWTYQNLTSPAGEPANLNQRLALLANDELTLDEIWEQIEKDRSYLLSGLYNKSQIQELKKTYPGYVIH